MYIADINGIDIDCAKSQGIAMESIVTVPKAMYIANINWIKIDCAHGLEHGLYVIPISYIQFIHHWVLPFC